MKKHEKPICASNISKIKKYVDDANVIFEIGAYDGVDIDEIRYLWNNPIIHAFEPDPEPFQYLIENYKDIAICNNIGLFNEEKDLTLYKYNDGRKNSNFNQKERDLWFKTAQSVYHLNHGLDNQPVEYEIKINVTTIDLYCEKNNIVPNIILMDTQGSESDILEGGINILNDNQLKAIMLEWSSQELYIGQKQLNYIIEFLKKYNFEMVEKINLWMTIHGDAIFIRK